MFLEGAAVLHHALTHSGREVARLLRFDFLSVFDHTFKDLHGAGVQEIDPLTIEERGGIKLENVVLPVEEFLEGVVGEGHLEGVFEMVLDLLAERAQIVL